MNEWLLFYVGFPEAGSNSHPAEWSEEQVLPIIQDTIHSMVDKLDKRTGFHKEIHNLVNGKKSKMGTPESETRVRGMEFNIRIMLQGSIIDGVHMRIDLKYAPHEVPDE